MINKPSAIVKFSWNGLAPSSLEGGVAGSCFTIETGVTISCIHNLDGIFLPNSGFDLCICYIVDPDGSFKHLDISMVEMHNGFDVSMIDCKPSKSRFVVSKKTASEIEYVTSLGYEANSAPFEIELSGGVPIPSNAEIFRCLRRARRKKPDFRTIDLNFPDVTISGKECAVIRAKGVVGMSGGPMIDHSTGEVFGVNSFGLPPDTHDKDYLGAVDFRSLLSG
jgi:hypothetical protein